MNNTKTPTVEKKIFPLRLPPDLYRKVRNEVQKEKDKGNYSYSINLQNVKTLISAIQKLVIKDVVLYADSKIAETKNIIQKR